MDDKWVNIDIIFRNGLKDMETLPPPDAWNHIRLNTGRRFGTLPVFRAAAMIAAVVASSYMVYRWNAEISSGITDNRVVFYPQPDYRITANDAGKWAEIDPALSRSPGMSDMFNAGMNTPIMPENVSADVQLGPAEPDENLRQPLAGGSLKVRNTGFAALNEDNNNRSLSRTDPAGYLPVIPAKEAEKRWAISALVSPAFQSVFNGQSEVVAKQQQGEEKQLQAYMGGISLSYRVNRRFSVQSGLYFSSFGNQLGGISAFGGFSGHNNSKGDHFFEIQTSRGIIYASNTDIFLRDDNSSGRIISSNSNAKFNPVNENLQYLDNSLRQDFSYIEFPVMVRYKLIDKAIDFNVIGGLSSNLLINNSVYATLDGERYQVGKTEGLNMLTVSSSLGMGLEYNFTRNLSLNLEPTLRYYLNPFSEIPGAKAHPYLFGFYSGLSLKF
jgi:hypothetical protein